MDRRGQETSGVGDVSSMGEVESLLGEVERKHQMGTAICCSFSFSGSYRERAPAQTGEWGAAADEG